MHARAWVTCWNAPNSGAHVVHRLCGRPDAFRSLRLRMKLAVRSPMRSLLIIMPSSAATTMSSGVACKNSQQELLPGQTHAPRGGSLYLVLTAAELRLCNQLLA